MISLDDTTLTQTVLAAMAKDETVILTRKGRPLVVAPKGARQDSPGQRPGTTGIPGEFEPCRGGAAQRSWGGASDVVSPFQGECGGRVMIFLHGSVITQGVALG